MGTELLNENNSKVNVEDNTYGQITFKCTFKYNKLRSEHEFCGIYKQFLVSPQSCKVPQQLWAIYSIS